MIFDTNELARAVLFFDENGEIGSEMHIAEFQAVLDGFVPLGDFAGVVTKACYVEFDVDFHVQRLVFFLLPINKGGEIDRSWHMPLMDLANAGIKSKDLGGGPVRLACHSQCPIAHVRSRLWDPDLSPSSNHLLKVKKAVADNRLRVQFRAEEDESSAITSSQRTKIEQELTARLRKEYAQEFRDHMAQLLKEQRLRITTSKSEFFEEHKQTKVDYEQRIQEYQRMMADKDRMLDEQRDMNQSLKNTVDGQAKKIEAMREYFEHKLESAGGHDGSVDVFKESFEVEQKAKFESESKELKEQLQMREVELLYRNELEVQLHDEIARLREENQKALVNTGEQLLIKLVETGISLVSYHPGAGHITIPLNEVAVYLESPIAYVAEKCSVSEERYTHWLEHYRMPVCQFELEEGKQCGENVERIEAPIDFKLGETDCCENCQKQKARSHLRVAGS